MIPNLLTLSRVFLGFSLFFLTSKQKIIVIILAGLTDFFDGYIARKFSYMTDMGIWMDPLADKIFCLCLFFSLAYEGLITKWVLGLFLSREIMIILGFLILKSKNPNLILPPLMISKLNTVFQMLYPMAILLSIRADIFMWMAVTTTILSGMAYIKRFIDISTQ